jgi:hypothetical protein
VDLQLSFHKHYEWPENRIKYSARPWWVTFKKHLHFHRFPHDLCN